MRFCQSREQPLTVLLARRKSGIWRVDTRTAQSGESKGAEAARAHAEATINLRLAQQRARLASFPLVWRQELPITTFCEGTTAFVWGEEFAEHLVQNKSDSGTIEGMQVEISRFVVETALERTGARVAGRWRRAITLRAMALGATLAALVWLSLLIGSSLYWPRLRHGQPRTVVVLHAEAANRTKHIRRALAGRDPTDTAVLFVGRLYLGAKGARAMLAESGWDHHFALLWDWRALLGGLPEGFALARQAAPAICAAGYRPTFAQLTALLLRILLGAGSAWRWRRAGRGVETVVFGHVGRADTILPEQAMQAMGAKTVHWMHGVSTGINFQGVSDLCVVQSLHDARWHDGLCHYGRNVGVPLPDPEPRRAETQGWAVLTNFTHPAYPPFRRIGPAHELALIKVISGLVARQGADPAQVMWKPHPVFYQADAATRRLVSDALDRAGFHLWPNEQTDFNAVIACGTIITGPSGVALDVLRRGRMPVVAEFVPMDPAHSLACFPLRGSDPTSLGQALDRITDPAVETDLIRHTWQAIGPCREPSLEEVLAAIPR